jgi:hypothetical protein
MKVASDVLIYFYYEDTMRKTNPLTKLRFNCSICFGIDLDRCKEYLSKALLVRLDATKPVGLERGPE